MSLEFRSLPVVICGRARSRRLRGMFNAIPGCVIRVENHSFCHGLCQAWQALSRTETHCQEQGVQATQRVEAGHGARLPSADRLLGLAQEFVEQHLQGYLRFLGKIMAKLGINRSMRKREQILFEFLGADCVHKDAVAVLGRGDSPRRPSGGERNPGKWIAFRTDLGAQTARHRLPMSRLLAGEAAELVAHDREGDLLPARLERCS